MKSYLFTSLLALLFAPSVLAVENLKLPIKDKSFARDVFGGMARDRRQCCPGSVICVACPPGQSSIDPLNTGDLNAHPPPPLPQTGMTHASGHSAALGLRAPSIFIIPTTIFQALVTVPRALARTIPSPETTNVGQEENGDLVRRQGWSCWGTTCAWSAGTTVRAPRLFALPTTILKTLVIVPRALARTIPSLETTNVGQEEDRDLVRRQGWSCWGATCVWSAGTTVRAPRLFALPTTILKMLVTIPRALARAIPSLETTNVGQEERSENGDLVRRQGCLIPPCVGSTGYNDRCLIPPCVGSAGATVRAPRLFALPALLFNTIGSIPKTLAAAMASGAASLPRALESSVSVSERNVESEGMNDLLTRACPIGSKSCINSIHLQWCRTRFGQYYHCSAGFSLQPPRLIALSALVINTLLSIPRVAASAIPSPLSSFDKREEPQSTNRNGAPQLNYCRAPDGFIVLCSAGPSLYPPRIFALPALVFSVLTSISRAIASALPAPSSPLDTKDDAAVEDLHKRQLICDEGGKHCAYSSTTISLPDFCYDKGEHCELSASATSLSRPRIFTLPTFCFLALYQASSVFAVAIPRPHQFTNSLAAPDFSLVRKAVSDFKAMFWELVKRGGGETREVKRGEQNIRGGGTGWRFGKPVYSGADGWENRLPFAWVGVMGAAVIFARNM